MNYQVKLYRIIIVLIVFLFTFSSCENNTNEEFSFSDDQNLIATLSLGKGFEYVYKVGEDIWFHTENIPGIYKKNQSDDIPPQRIIDDEILSFAVCENGIIYLKNDGHMQALISSDLKGEKQTVIITENCQIRFHKIENSKLYYSKYKYNEGDELIDSGLYEIDIKTLHNKKIGDMFVDSLSINNDEILCSVLDDEEGFFLGKLADGSLKKMNYSLPNLAKVFPEQVLNEKLYFPDEENLNISAMNIKSGRKEKIIDFGNTYFLLTDYIFFIKDANLIRCDLDGNNIMKVDENISEDYKPKMIDSKIYYVGIEGGNEICKSADLDGNNILKFVPPTDLKN